MDNHHFISYSSADALESALKLADTSDSGMPVGIPDAADDDVVGVTHG